MIKIDFSNHFSAMLIKVGPVSEEQMENITIRNAVVLKTLLSFLNRSYL